MNRKIILDLDDIDIVMTKLNQAESIAYVMACNNDLEKDEANVFWAIKDLIENAKNLFENKNAVQM
ncbi:hypothetical protein DES39_0560 [Orbus hercynius]|uniref:Uncharacterized protein n=1 Tax=Orbus hercynius TaxID=593135 RepID=A0A495RIZ9_9GAMM|nr:hypothetical protein [Orbus hercynius]RKS87339.1 hypothetical protein DES39_0560 [Orbus hercynius]